MPVPLFTVREAQLKALWCELVVVSTLLCALGIPDGRYFDVSKIKAPLLAQFGDLDKHKVSQCALRFCSRLG